MTSATTTQSDKAARGTKRVCQACEVRFYDLRRDPIVCPSCGAQYTPMAQPPAEAGRRAAPVGGKTGWRQSVKRPSPVLPEPNPEDAIRPEVVAEAEDLDVATEEVADAAADDDIVLDTEPEDADVSGLIEVDVEEPKER
jgi:uncharacterized protein (TIGR02300 family)